MNKIQEIPNELKEPVFEKVFEEAAIAKLSPEEYSNYEQSLKVYRDLSSSFSTAKEEGFNRGKEDGFEEGMEKGMEKGREEEREKIIAKLRASGMSDEEISNLLKG